LLTIIFLAVVALFFIFSTFFSTGIVGQCVAVVDINTPLTVEGMPTTLFDVGYPGSEELAYSIEEINERDDVGAVVFVFNSPGGSVVATREVYNAVNELDKPSVSYFREVAASGAYYVASGSDYIVSDPDALTGSIGVIATVTQMADLFDKIGVNVTAIKSGPHKDIGSSFRNMTSEEQQILQVLVDEIYEEFRQVILLNRKGKLDLAKFDEVSDGRILSGRQAYKAGLVDELGTKKDAIKKAAELANISYTEYDDIRVCYVDTMPAEGGLFSAEGMLRHIGITSQVPSVSYQ
jgi:protease-4